MKYFNIQSLNRTIERIVDGNITHEHRTSTATLGLCRHYFPVEKFAITSEQIQPVTNKKPDFVIEKYREISNDFYIHTTVEVKSLIGRNISDILVQLRSTMDQSLDLIGFESGNYSTFIIAMKGVKIAFYMYHNFAPLLEDYGIHHYDGFIPLTQVIPQELLSELNQGPALGISFNGRINFNTDSAILTHLGVQGIPTIPHPHVFDLLNVRHREDIHKIFTFIAASNPNLLFAD